MTDHSQIDHGSTHEVISDLFERAPSDEVELRCRLGGVDTEVARRLVVDRLFANDLKGLDGPIALAVLDVTGIGKEKERLRSVALDNCRDSRTRLWAAMALANEAPSVMDRLITELGPQGIEILAEVSLMEQLSMRRLENIGESIAAALEEWRPERPAGNLFSLLELCRKGVGATCSEAYRQVLASDDLVALRSGVLDLFVEEASDEGIDLLEKMRDKALADDARRDFQAALLRLRSRRIEAAHAASGSAGYALVSNCDSQGGFIVLGIFENGDGTTSVSELYIRADGDVRDGVCHSKRNAFDVTTLEEQLRIQTDCVFTRTGLAEGASLVAEGLERTEEAGKALPDEVRLAVEMFEPVAPAFQWGRGACCAPADERRLEQMSALLARPEYEDTWLFDLGELSEMGIVVPHDSGKLDAWLEANRRTLDGSPMGQRLVAMAEHMARWHLWNGEPDLAALCRAMAEDAGRGVARSRLARVMLERSIE